MQPQTTILPKVNVPSLKDKLDTHPLLSRLVKEVTSHAVNASNYDRVHNRHNRNR